jgi:hypothetical protein
MTKYAVLCYSTKNIGDDMQSFAASQYISGKPALLYRDRLDSPLLYLNRYKPIMNGWFMSRPKHWPPVSTIDPLIISFHISPWKGRSDRMLEGRGLEYFKHQAARRGVGARDLHALRLFHDAGIDAYYSGCLTMTIKPPADAVRTEDLYVVDVSDPVLAKIRERTKAPVHVMSHNISKSMTQAQRRGLVEKLWRSYASARAVVTSRIHVAFPCLAMGTPVLMVHSNPSDPRFEGIVDHLHFTSTDAFLDGRYSFDLSSPPANKNTHLAMAKEMEARCKAFVSEVE